jgi:hypothetical protein
VYGKRANMCRLLFRGVILFIALIFSIGSSAQPIMKRSSFVGTYTAISVVTGATLSSASGDNAFEDLIPIGFTFNYLGTNYTTIGVSTNGIAAFTGITATANNMNLYVASGPVTVLAPWWDDLNVQTGTGSIVYQTQGTSGNRTFTIQWSDVNSYSSGSTALLNFQIILYELNGKIEFRYGAAPTGTFNTTNESASIGIKSATGGSGQFIDAVTGSAFTGNGMLCAATMWPSKFFRFLPGVPVPISQGVYTVGASGDYYNLSEAVADLNHRGVTGTGTITFSMTDSVYDDTPLHGDNFFPVLIGPVNGASVSTSVHFQSFATTIVRSPGAMAGNCATQNSQTAIGISNEPVIGLVGAQYMSVSSFTIQSSSANVDRGVLVLNSSLTAGTRNCGIQNLIISLDRSNINSIGVEQMETDVPASYAGSNSWNIFSGLNISDAYAGILVTGDATFQDSSTTINNCIIGATIPDDIGNGSVATFAIRAVNERDIAITNNRIRNIAVNGNVSCSGILLENGRGICNVYGNKVHAIRNNNLSSTADIIGISASVATGGTHELRIFNNFVFDLTSAYTGSASALVQVKGIAVQLSGGGSASSMINIDFNNVGINSNSLLVSSTCFESGTVTGPVINTRNNIFSNSTAAQVSPAAHFCFVTPAANAIGNSGSVSDHNDLFIANSVRGFIGKGNATTYASFANWQSAMSSDAASLNIDPSFASATDMHILNTALNSVGQSLPWVSMDIDNQVRYAIPDIGADEIFPPDPSPISLLSPTLGDCYTSAEPVIVRVINAGNSLLDFTIDTVPVTVEITGALTQTMTVLLNDNSRNNGDPLPVGGYVDVLFGTINMAVHGTYYFSVHTSLSYDGDPYNDTLAPVTIVVASPEVIISGNFSVCEGGSTTLTANASGGDGNYSYQWSYGLGINQSVTVSPAHDSLFYVSVTDGCGIFANDSILVQVLPDPTADFTFNQANNVITFSDNSQSATAWSWDFGDTQNSTQQNPSHTYTSNGTYTVVLTTSNNCGTDTATAVITIITTGIDPLSSAHTFSIYPNPAHGSFTVYLPEAEDDLIIELEDVNGKLLRKNETGNTMEGMSFVMDMSGYENGIYFLRVSTVRFSEVQKIIKQ